VSAEPEAGRSCEGAASRRAVAVDAGTLLGAGLAAAGVLCFSLRPVLVKLAYAQVADPVTLLALRMLFSLPFFLGAAFWTRRAPRQGPISPRDGLAMVGLGIIGYYLASYLDFLGLQYISAGLGRLVLFLYPTLVVLLSIIVLRKPVRRQELAALVLSYAGIALVLSPTLDDPGRNLPLGAALVFASGAIYAVYLVAGTEIVRRVGSVRFSAYATTVASLCCIAQFFALRPVSALELPAQVYAIAAVIGIVCTALPIFMTSEALRRIGANRVAIVGALDPVSTIVFAYLGLDEYLTAVQLAGAALVVAGVVLVCVLRRGADGYCAACGRSTVTPRSVMRSLGCGALSRESWPSVTCCAGCAARRMEVGFTRKSMAASSALTISGSPA
jgi:drug/metabolite transporter (DMT)-like permease